MMSLQLAPPWRHAPARCARPAPPGSAVSPLPCQAQLQITIPLNLNLWAPDSEHKTMNYSIPVGLIDLIRQSKHVLLASHVNADGDAYGSLLGMKLILEAIGKRPHAAMHDPVMEDFFF